MVGYVGQANITQGPHQVNNATTSVQAAAPAPEHEKLPNELLEAKDGEWLDCAAKSQASDADPAMATVGTIDRP
jgi:hypothetical protein